MINEFQGFLRCISRLAAAMLVFIFRKIYNKKNLLFISSGLKESLALSVSLTGQICF